MLNIDRLINKAMTVAVAAWSPKLETVQWDDALDFLENLILTDENVCSRAQCYYFQNSTMDVVNVAPFEYVAAANDEFMKIGWSMYGKFRHRFMNKWSERSAALYETRLVVALHYHPLIRERHICFLPYRTASHYGVEQLLYDTRHVFHVKQTFDYADILVDVRKLFACEDE